MGCLRYPDKLCTIIRRPLVEICGGNICAAALLSNFEHWQDIRDGNNDLERSTEKAAMESGVPYKPEIRHWIYKSHQDLADSTLGAYSRRTVIPAMELLEKLSFVQVERQIDDNGFQWPNRYRLNSDVINKALDVIHQKGSAKLHYPPPEAMQNCIGQADLGYAELHTNKEESYPASKSKPSPPTPSNTKPQSLNSDVTERSISPDAIAPDTKPECKVDYCSETDSNQEYINHEDVRLIWNRIIGKPKLRKGGKDLDGYEANLTQEQAEASLVAYRDETAARNQKPAVWAWMRSLGARKRISTITNHPASPRGGKGPLRGLWEAWRERVPQDNLDWSDFKPRNMPPPEFFQKFDLMCEKSAKIRKTRADSGWLNFGWLFGANGEENWRKLLRGSLDWLTVDKGTIAPLVDPADVPEHLEMR